MSPIDRSWQQDEMKPGAKGRTGWRRRWRVLLWVLVGMTCTVVAVQGWREVWRWRVARAIVRFEADPSQTGANELVRLLSKEAATADQGSHILESLLRPSVTMRAAYPAGEAANVALEIPFQVHVWNGRIEMDRTVRLGGQRLRAWPKRVTSALRTSPELLSPCPEILEPGQYRFMVHYECCLTKRRGGSSMWTRLRDRFGRQVLRRRGTGSWVSFETTYESRFAVPIAVCIAREGEAERLEVASDEELGEEKRTTFAAWPVRTHSVYWTEAGRRYCTESTHIAYGSLPVGLSFALSLRLPDGRELPSGALRRRQKIRLRAREAGHFTVEPGWFGIAEAGEHGGTLVLRPDPAHAYEDPAIKRIWGGTVELPISFTVSIDPDIPH